MRSAKDLGAYIFEKRKKAGLTQEAFAGALGISAQAVSKWENGVGYPDVVLFPEIARTLGVEINELFGEKPDRKAPGFPETRNGLPLCHIWKNKACYSGKTVEKISENTVVFSDGSLANLASGEVENRGEGEVVIFSGDDGCWEYDSDGPTELVKELPPFEDISVTISGSYDVDIISGDPGVYRIEAEGTAEFIAALEFGVENGRLTLSNKKMHGNGNRAKIVRVFFGLKSGREFCAAVNGSGDITLGQDFEKLNLIVNGSGDINCKNAGSAEVQVNGSGVVSLEKSGAARFRVNGSGDIRTAGCKDPKVQVNGSGCIELGEVSGSAELRIFGSGDMSLSGEIGKLYCEIGGSGSIDGKKLSVGEAELRCEGAAEIELGRIRDFSKEKLSKDSVLKVGKRG